MFKNRRKPVEMFHETMISVCVFVAIVFFIVCLLWVYWFLLNATYREQPISSERTF